MKTKYVIESVDGIILEESESYNCIIWWLWDTRNKWQIVGSKTNWSENVPSVKIVRYKVDKR